MKKNYEECQLKIFPQKKLISFFKEILADTSILILQKN